MQINFDTGAFTRSTGKAPKGWGVWAFTFEGDVTEQSDEPWFTSRAVSYTEAKKAAKSEAARRAVCSDAIVYVVVQP